MISVKYILAMLLIFIALSLSVYALTYGNLTVVLIKTPLSFDTEQRVYTPECMGDCHMVLRFKWSGADFTLQKSDLKTYKTRITGLDNLQNIRIQYLDNVSYQENITNCNDVWNITNNSYSTVCSFTLTDKWKAVWKPIPNNIPINSGEWYVIDIIGYKTPSTIFSSVDIVPEFKGINLTDYAWWNSSWNYCKNITITNPQANYPFMFNVTNTTNIYPNRTDVRFVDTYCNNGGNSLSWDIRANTSTFFTTDILLNGVQTIISMYYNNTGATSFNNNTQAVWDNRQSSLVHDTPEDEGTGNPADILGETASSNLGDWASGVNARLGSSIKYTRANSDYTSFGAVHNINYVTVEAWINKTTDTGAGEYYCIITKSNQGWNFCIDPNDRIYLDVYAGGSWLAAPLLSTSILTANRWYFIAVTYDGTDAKIYVNGTQENSTAKSGTLGTGSINYGSWDTTVHFMNGVTDEGKIYSQALNSTEISNHYAVTEPTGTLGTESAYGGNQAPLWSSNSSSTPSSYSPSTQSIFNITWINGSVSNIVNTSYVYLESNFSGSATNYTMSLISGTSLSGIYGYNNITPAGTFYWKVFAKSNDTIPLWNTSTTWNFTISNASNPTTFCVQNSTATNCVLQNSSNCWGTPQWCWGWSYTGNESYPNPINYTGSCIGGTLYKNASSITSGAWQYLGVNLYRIDLNCTGNANYSSNYSTGASYINKGTPLINITFNTSNSIIQGTPYLATCNKPAELTVTFSNDTGNIANPFAVNSNSLLGTYNYSCVNVSGNANYTGNTGTNAMTVTLGGGLNILAVYDEKTLAPLNFNLTIYNSTFSITSNNINNYYNNSVIGSLTIAISKVGYIQRNYHINTNVNFTTNVTGYLLDSSSGVYVTYWSYSDINPLGEIASLHSFKRFIGSSNVEVLESQADTQGKGTVYLDPYTTYVIDSQTADSSLTTNISSYNPNPSFILKISFNSVTTGTNQSWFFTQTTYSLIPTDIYLRPNVSGNVTLFNYTTSSGLNDIQWYSLRLIYWNGTVFYTGNDTTHPAGGSLTVNLNYTNLNGTVIAQTFIKKQNYTTFTLNRSYVVWYSHSALPEAIAGLKTSGLSSIAQSLISLFVSYGVSLLVSRFLRVGSGIVFLGVMLFFTIAGMFTWPLFIGLALMETGFLMFMGVW